MLKMTALVKRSIYLLAIKVLTHCFLLTRLYSLATKKEQTDIIWQWLYMGLTRQSFCDRMVRLLAQFFNTNFSHHKNWHFHCAVWAFSAFFKSKTSSKKPFFKSNRIDCVTKAVFRDRLKIFRSKHQRANKTY